MSGLKSAFAAIHSINAEPELKFAAAMVAAAAEDARHGDCDAFLWLESPCSLRWLVAIVPTGDDCERIQRALLATIPEPECPPLLATEWGEHMMRRPFREPPSETSRHVVQLSLELEDLQWA